MRGSPSSPLLLQRNPLKMIRWNGKRYIPAGVKPLIRRRNGNPVPGKPNARWVAGWVGGLGEEPTPVPETCHIEAQNGDLLTAQNGDYIDHFPCIEPSPTPTTTTTPTQTPTNTPTASMTPTITPSQTTTNTPTPTITSSNTPTPTPSTPSVDPDAAAYLADVVASGGTTNPTIESAVNTLFTDLKSNGFYSKMIAMYPYVGSTAASHAINATLDKTYDITWYGGMTHGISGSTGNGTNAYGDTNFVERAFTDNNKASFGSYMTITGNDGVDGINKDAFSKRMQMRYNVSNQIRYGFGDGDSKIYNHGGSVLNGNYAQIRTGNTENKLYHNGLNLDTQLTSNNNNSNSASYYIFRFNFGTPYWGTYTLGFYYFINDITYAEVPILQNIINTFQTSLGRNVY